MNDQQTRWQDDAMRAFDWITEMYNQAANVKKDATAFFEEDGWEPRFREGWGGDAYTTKLNDWPFVYLTAFCATPGDYNEDGTAGTAAVFGIAFYDGERRGPHCFAGRVRWSDSKAVTDHWMLYYALGSPGGRKDCFERSGDGIRTAKPTSKGRAEWPGVEEVTWFEVPLAVIDSADRLQSIVKAAEAMARADDGPARLVVSGSAGKN